ncbi:hypothetical protein MAR_013387 [Mya arenaria]|uniref:Uncharacterized protein n=1 Tax=Mya arenaria TaxID=6604 RepID=A0ABY7G3G3_MYAAR|nr:hypothetical protein MAR_013387 [Mya arenaria]
MTRFVGRKQALDEGHKSSKANTGGRKGVAGPDFKAEIEIDLKTAEQLDAPGEPWITVFKEQLNESKMNLEVLQRLDSIDMNLQSLKEQRIPESGSSVPNNQCNTRIERTDPESIFKEKDQRKTKLKMDKDDINAPTNLCKLVTREVYQQIDHKDGEPLFNNPKYLEMSTGKNLIHTNLFICVYLLNVRHSPDYTEHCNKNYKQ